MPMSTKRANFYKEVYFPSVYYKEVFATTLEEAKDIQEARAELDKLIIDADTNLARLSETFRERALSPSQQLQVQADKDLLAAEGAQAERGAAATRAFAADPAAGPRSKIELELDNRKKAGTGTTDAEKSNIVAVEAKRSMAGQPPAIQRRIYADLAAKYGTSGPLTVALQDALGQPGLQHADILAQVASPEDKAVIEGMKRTGATPGPKTPAGEAAQARLDAMASPFANASTEQTTHIAAGITDGEDELLRLYLSRLQDRESPGMVSEAELAANPELVEAEQVYNRVKADNSFQKSAAEWFSSEYLTALNTKARLEKKAEADPFEGLDPYRWAQKQAFERGGYTKESVLYLRMLTERPDLAPYVTPAFDRLRDEKGIEPKDAAEAVVKEAFIQSKGKLTVAELDAELAKKRAELTKTGRQVAREEGVTMREGMDIRKTTRATAKELYGSPEAAEAAKAYLLALRLNAAGTKAAPTSGTEIVAPAPLTPPVPPQVSAGATVNRAESNAKAAAQRAAEGAQAAQEAEGGSAPTPTPTPPQAPPKPPPAPAPSPTPEDEVERTLQERVRTELPPAQQAFLSALPGRELPAGQQAPSTGGRGFTTDPTDPDYKYMLTPSGDYAVLYKGLPTTPAKKGSRAARSIERVMAGQSPLPALPKPAPVPAPAPPAPMKRLTLPPTDIPAPTPAPAPTPVPAPTPAPASEATQLRNLIKSGTVKRGTPQYDAAIQRLADLEG